jgi:excisionase family DNA binding protein
MLLSVNEAAKRLGISPSLVYALCAAKRLRHERYGMGRGKIRIPEAALDEYRKQATVDACPAVPARRKNGRHLR